MRLADCRIGDKIKIVEVNAGGGAVQNLARLGLRIGNVCQVLRVSFLRGPVMVYYRDTEIAVGYRLARKIRVQKV